MTTEEHTAAAAEPPFAKYPSPLLEWHAHVVITRSFKGSAPSLPLPSFHLLRRLDTAATAVQLYGLTKRDQVVGQVHLLSPRSYGRLSK